MKKGRIPERMIAYLKPEKESLGEGKISNWWSFAPDLRETPKFSRFQARAAFVVPSDSDAFKETASNWASETQCGKPKAFDTHGFENESFSDLRWVGIDSRSEGGVVFKVLTPQGWLVDLREDVVIECLMEGAIENKNGPQGIGTYFTAEFIWVVMGSQTRLVRVGSEVYEDIMESVILRGMGPIPEKDLEVGGIYLKSNGQEVAILDIGKVKGRKFLCIYRSGSAVTFKDQIRDSITILDRPNCYPFWNFCGSLKVIKQTGTIDLPAGLGERFSRKRFN
jgi:hypothetical protein